MKRREGVKITSAILRRAGTCSRFRSKFRKRFPKGVYVTPALCVKFALHPLFMGNWGWALDHLLTVPEATKISPYGIDTPSCTPGRSDQVVRSAVFAARFGALLQEKEFRNSNVFK